MGDGEQGDAGVLGRLEDLAFYVNAHSAGALVQEGVLGPGRMWGAKVLALCTLLHRSLGLPPPTAHCGNPYLRTDSAFSAQCWLGPSRGEAP